MNDSFYMDNNRLLMQTKIMVIVQIRKKRELPSEGVAISHKLTENWYMAPTCLIIVEVFEDIIFPTFLEV